MVISWGAIGGSFIAPYVYGLFLPRVSKAAGIASMLIGLGTAMLLYVAWGEPGVPIAGAVALIVPLVVHQILSLFPSRQVAREAVGRTS